MEEKKSFGYGWFLTVLCGMFYFMSSGFIVASAQILNPAMMADIGISATVLGLGFTIFVWCSGLPAPLVGILIDKIGTRWSIAIGGLIMTVGAICMTTIVHSAVGYIIFFGIFMALGNIMAGQVSIQSTIGFWFQKRRGKAMSIAMGIGGLGSFVAPLAVSNLIKDGSWQNGWILLAVFGIVIAVLSILFVRTHPEEKGLEVDGGETTAEVKTQKVSKAFKNSEKLTAKQILRMPSFWLLAMLGSGGFSAFALQSSMGVLNFKTLGFDPAFIASVAAIYGIIALIFKTVSGFIADYIDGRQLMIIGLVVAIIGEVCAAFASSEIMVWAFYICNGFAFGITATCLPTTVANYFGLYSFGKSLGTTMAIGSILSGLVSLAVGAVYDATGACAPGILGVSALLVICIIAGLLCRPKNVAAVKGEGE